MVVVFYSFVRVRFKPKRSKLSNSTWRNFCCIHVAHDYFPICIVFNVLVQFDHISKNPSWVLIIIGFGDKNMKLKQDPTIYILPYSKCVVYDALKTGSP